MKIEQSCVETPAPLRGVKDLLRKLTRKERNAPENQDESKYVDLECGEVDADTGGARPEEDRRLGEGDQMSVLINGSGAGALRATGRKEEQASDAAETDAGERNQSGGRAGDAPGGPCDPPTPTDGPGLNRKSEERPQSGDNGERALTHPEVSGKDGKKARGEEGVHCSDGHQKEASESDDYEEDDDVSLVLGDDCIPCLTEDESHYITTHEIQLSELSDHEEDYDLAVGSSASWDIEDANQVYSFVDYASFDGDGGAGGERGDGGRPRSRSAAAVSSLLESDPCDAAKFNSSDESVSKPQAQQRGGSGAGQIHLSIRTTSRAINDPPGSIQERGNILYHARRSGDMSRYVLRGVDGKAETLCDRAKCFIAAPGRAHCGRRWRGKEATGGSSGASSAVSELDDADKEVRNLTARAFKSLAYPYFDAINFSTSSESSASEHGLGINRWSTFVDLKYGNMNVSQGLDQSVVSRQNSTASFEITKNVDNRGYKGIALASIKPPTSKIFSLNGKPHSASKIELMGKFSQGHSEVIRLTETLNFRCNVKSGMSEGERRTNFAQNAEGSRSTDEVTSTLPGRQSRGAIQPPAKTMEDTHKKAIFASSLIKNVISKKMQFEQERKMERGEISEPHHTPSPSFVQQESDGLRGKGSWELHRQTSRFSESSSELALMCMDELGDLGDSGSCDTKSDSRRQDTTAPAPESKLEAPNEAGIDTKRGAMDACKSTLLRSQNSAFRCWKDGELEFPKDHKSDKTPEDKSPPVNDKEGEGDLYSSGCSKLTKMSHLFVPSIQLLSSDGEVGQQLRNRSYSPPGDGEGMKLRADNTFYIADSRSVATSKSPEIKINLRRVRDNKTESFGVSKLHAPNIGCNAASLIRTDDFKCQALAAALKGESSDKVPHFMVRDIRDNKGKLQTPIHQVRDVRKLVKSSYHFVSLDNNDNKSNCASGDSHSEQKKQMPYRNPNSVSPIVIKCQSVNTNSNGKQSVNLTELTKRETLDVDTSEDAKASLLQRAAGRTPTGHSNNSSEMDVGLNAESRAASKRQEKMADIPEKKPESKVTNQVALAKLQAAVKTMEQLYVFERNEWKRKNEPRPLTDSHVLSLLSGEEQGGPEEDGARGSNMDKAVRRDSYPNTERPPLAGVASLGTDNLLRQEDRLFQSPGSRDDWLFAKSAQAPSAPGNKSVLSLSSSLKASATSRTPQPNTVPPTPFNAKTFAPKSPKLPVSLKISQMKQSGNESSESKEVERSVREHLGASADNENYLTIPVKSHASNHKQASSADKTSVYTLSAQTDPTTPPGHLGSSMKGLEDHNQSPKRSSFVMEARSPEIPPATIYHSLPLGMAPSQPQVYCFSPAVTPAPTLEPFQATQKKMLLDPTTGSYYLVDTPVQPATKRLFDPETGQYVDVPMPQPPMTPVPMPISPLALSPGAYGHTYMIYPSFMQTPSVIPARTLVQSQMSVQSEVESGEKNLSQQAEGMYMESPFYMATGKSPQAQQQATANRSPQCFSSVGQPVISITSQQGPRIIAPPSFDGTTMSFVVEHR